MRSLHKLYKRRRRGRGPASLAASPGNGLKAICDLNIAVIIAVMRTALMRSIAILEIRATAAIFFNGDDAPMMHCRECRHIASSLLSGEPAVRSQV